MKASIASRWIRFRRAYRETVVMLVHCTSVVDESAGGGAHVQWSTEPTKSARPTPVCTLTRRADLIKTRKNP